MVCFDALAVGCWIVIIFSVDLAISETRGPFGRWVTEWSLMIYFNGSPCLVERGDLLI